MAWDFWQYWYYNIPNYLLALLTYTLLGRLLLGFFVPEDWNNYIWRAFIRITDPVVAVVRYITPMVVAHLWILILAALWVHLIRIAFTLVMLSLGLVPMVDTSVEPLPR
jgi:hypothetical protein